MEIRNCLICGKEIRLYPSDIKTGCGKYCSKICLGKALFKKETKHCLVCNKEFKVIPSKIRIGWGKYCSNKCRGKAQIKERNWNGENHPFWKGNDVGYYALHAWVKKHKPKPLACERCGRINCRLECANRDGKYSRNPEDYDWLCRKCHTKQDGVIEKWWTKSPTGIKYKQKEQIRKGEY